ncbi:MAG: hypothetical protein IJ848_00675 [Alphaproteobacteria bacterium]|nr:hypothetical protein [Alphaproteobacteria bacterium]
MSYSKIIVFGFLLNILNISDVLSSSVIKNNNLCSNINKSFDTVNLHNNTNNSIFDDTCTNYFIPQNIDKECYIHLHDQYISENVAYAKQHIEYNIFKNNKTINSIKREQRINNTPQSKVKFWNDPNHIVHANSDAQIYDINKQKKKIDCDFDLIDLDYISDQSQEDIKTQVSTVVLDNKPNNSSTSTYTLLGADKNNCNYQILTSLNSNEQNDIFQTQHYKEYCKPNVNKPLQCINTKNEKKKNILIRINRDKNNKTLEEINLLLQTKNQVEHTYNGKDSNNNSNIINNTQNKDNSSTIKTPQYSEAEINYVKDKLEQTLHTLYAMSFPNKNITKISITPELINNFINEIYPQVKIINSQGIEEYKERKANTSKVIDALIQIIQEVYPNIPIINNISSGQYYNAQFMDILTKELSKSYSGLKITSHEFNEQYYEKQFKDKLIKIITSITKLHPDVEITSNVFNEQYYNEYFMNILTTSIQKVLHPITIPDYVFNELIKNVDEYMFFTQYLSKNLMKEQLLAEHENLFNAIRMYHNVQKDELLYQDDELLYQDNDLESYDKDFITSIYQYTYCGRCNLFLEKAVKQLVQLLCNITQLHLSEDEIMSIVTKSEEMKDITKRIRNRMMKCFLA